MKRILTWLNDRGHLWSIEYAISLVIPLGFAIYLFLLFSACSTAKVNISPCINSAAIQGSKCSDPNGKQSDLPWAKMDNFICMSEDDARIFNNACRNGPALGLKLWTVSAKTVLLYAYDENFDLMFQHLELADKYYCLSPQDAQTAWEFCGFMAS